MIDLLEKADAACAIECKTLRFSQVWMPIAAREAGRGFRWAEISTSSIAIMQFLCACWNHRQEIAAMLRARLDDGK